MIGVVVQDGIVQQIIQDALLCDGERIVFFGGEARGFAPGAMPLMLPDGENMVVGAPLSVTADVMAAMRRTAKARIAAARWEAEVGGCTLQDMPLRTDRESQAMITGAALKAMQDSSYTCAWKGMGGWVELIAPQILAIADAVRAHVQACFNHERALNALVDAAETVAELEEITW